MYYKVKALAEGVRIHLHRFEYGRSHAAAGRALRKCPLLR